MKIRGAGALVLMVVAAAGCGKSGTKESDDNAVVASETPTKDESKPMPPKPATAEGEAPPPCGELFTANDVKETCGLDVKFAEVPLRGKDDYRCEGKGFIDGNKHHHIDFRVLDMGSRRDAAIAFREKKGVSRIAKGQKGRYRFSVNEAIFGAQGEAAHKCSEDAITQMAQRIESRLP